MTHSTSRQSPPQSRSCSMPGGVPTTRHHRGQRRQPLSGRGRSPPTRLDHGPQGRRHPHPREAHPGSGAIGGRHVRHQGAGPFGSFLSEVAAAPGRPDQAKPRSSGADLAPVQRRRRPRPRAAPTGDPDVAATGHSRCRGRPRGRPAPDPHQDVAAPALAATGCMVGGTAAPDRRAPLSHHAGRGPTTAICFATPIRPSKTTRLPTPTWRLRMDRWSTSEMSPSSAVSSTRAWPSTTSTPVGVST